MITRMRTFSLLLAIVLSSNTAWSQERDAAKADTLFREARTLMKSGDFESACPKLVKSQRLDPAAGTAVNLGDCWEKTGRLADALQAYRDALDLLSAGDHRIEPVKQQIAAMEKRVPRLTVKLAPGAPDGTKVKRDDLELGEGVIWTAMPVNPGDHWIVVVAPGRPDTRSKVTLTEGQKRELVVEAGVEAGNDASIPAPTGRRTPKPAKVIEKDSDSGSSPPTAGYVFAGIGVLGLATGITTAKMAADKKLTVDENCNAQKVCNSTGYDAVQAGQTLKNISLVGWGAGIAGLAAGAYFLFVAGPSKDTGTAVGAAATPYGGAVSVKGRF